MLVKKCDLQLILEESHVDGNAGQEREQPLEEFRHNRRRIDRGCWLIRDDVAQRGASASGCWMPELCRMKQQRITCKSESKVSE